MGRRRDGLGALRGGSGGTGTMKFAGFRRNREICQFRELHDSRGSATRGGKNKHKKEDMSAVKVCGVLEMCSDATPKTVHCNRRRRKRVALGREEGTRAGAAAG